MVMVKQAEILFAHEVEGKAYLTEFVADNGGNISTTFVDEQLQVIVKKVNMKNRSLDKVRMIAGDISKQLKKLAIEEGKVDDNALVKAFDSFSKEELVTAFVEGWHLGAYEFDAYKSKKAKEKAQLTFVNEAEVGTAVLTGEIRAASMSFSRDLMNEPGDALNPETYPEVLKKEFEGSGVDVVVHDKNALEEMKMNGLLTVNRGSKYDPAFVELHYKGDESKPLVALVGKGVTFDTGGISLKGGRNISDMRMDMGGSAAVAGAMKLLAESGAKVNVVGLIQIVENMPDRHSFLPGDVIHYKNGKTVQIGNTDAEGRLILADGLIRAGELEADYIVDIATLTGAVVAALGTKVAGIFGEIGRAHV